LGLTVELWNPGGIVPGVIGGVFLLLAFFAFQVLPVDTTGLLLVVFGLALLILEIKVPSFGALGIGGATALVIGSVMLTDDLPGVEVSYQFVIPVALAVAGIALVLGRLAIKAHSFPRVSGAEGLIGERGWALTDLRPDQPGQITVHGEIWRATSAVPVEANRPVRVVQVNGLTLVVEPVDAHLHDGGLR
jgi:membrane-bound serine protease (ClpP class)